jgi:heat shock protein HspQ|tara:strand:- start:130 stop:462 length:333 start_codon:yes stop_codon:yes gene_type:complete
MSIDPTSFCIQLKPVIDADYAWTGELEVNIITDKNNPLDKPSYLSLMHLSEVVACSVAYMEENPDLIGKIEEFIDRPDNDEIPTKEEPEIQYTDGNVVKLNFGSRTKGNA